MSDAATATPETAAPAAEDKKPAVRRKMKLKNKILLYVISLLLIGFLRTGFLFVIIGLLPSIVAYFMDVTSNRHNFKTVFACNLTGMLPYLGTMLQNGPASQAVLQSVMGDMNAWLIIYGAAMMGMLLVKICPQIAQFLIVGIAHTQIGHIEHVQKKIENEWGEEVTQFSKANIEAAEEEEEDRYA